MKWYLGAQRFGIWGNVMVSRCNDMVSGTMLWYLGAMKWYSGATKSL